MSNVGIVICSRSDSQRIPNKPFIQINGSPILEHLIRRLLPTGIHIYLAVPHFDFDLYRNFAQRFSKKEVTVVAGSPSDPLARMTAVAQKHSLDTVIRVCHDKIFMEPKSILSAVEVFHESKLDYLYSSTFVDGSGFEIISTESLTKASEKYKNVEHIGYAIHCVTTRVTNISCNTSSQHRLLIDYPEDLKVIDLILSGLGNDCSLSEALDFLDQNPFISHINKLPLLTIYSCAFNAEKWIGRAMGSISMQEGFKEFQYLLIDDFSADKTSFLMSQFCSIYKNSEWIRNKSNLGLASSSNIALSRAKGKYILRLDADDYFVRRDALKQLIDCIESSKNDIVYPDNYFGSFKKIQKGNENHHVGGAIFRTRAANHVKFTDGLRGYEGYDFFERAKDSVKIGYYEKPIFFYRQHDASLSASNEEWRKQLKAQIDEGLTKGNRINMPAMP